VTATGNPCIAAEVIIINGGEVTAISPYNEGISGISVTINGGQVTVSGNTGIHTDHGNVNINGGQVTASGDYYGILADDGNINLGWTKSSDFIQVNKYALLGDGNHTLTLAKNFIDEDGILYEMGIIQQVNGAYPIDGKKLMPCGVPYLDENGEQQFCVEYIALDGTETELGIEDEETWYVVNSDVSYTNLGINGDVHLILVDGKTMSAQCESNFGAIMGYADLTIYGQSQGTGTLASSGAIAAMDITMNGGTVNVNATDNYAIYTMGDFIINDGTLYTEGATGIMAQSMGAKASPASEVTSNITINGGKVTAIGTYSENGVAFGMGATGIITLGWKNNTDYIYSNGYYADSILRIAEGKAFIDDYDNIYSGIIDTVSGGYYPFDGDTLYPYVAITKSISGHNNSGGWYLIASPVADAVMPTEANGILSNENEFDLYRFNPTNEGYEWENYKTHADDFVLVNGQGYLYASSDTTTLVFAGVPVAGHTYEIELEYDADDEHKCWNLVGNPFDTAAKLNKDCYTLSADGSDISSVAIPAGTPIPPCTAVFVKAVSDGDTVVFTKVTQ
jgi:hypothetical protein